MWGWPVSIANPLVPTEGLVWYCFTSTFTPHAHSHILMHHTALRVPPLPQCHELPQRHPHPPPASNDSLPAFLCIPVSKPSESEWHVSVVHPLVSLHEARRLWPHRHYTTVAFCRFPLTHTTSDKLIIYGHSQVHSSRSASLYPARAPRTPPQ
jgi:hypothetical protein